MKERLLTPFGLLIEAVGADLAAVASATLSGLRDQHLVVLRGLLHAVREDGSLIRILWRDEPRSSDIDIVSGDPATGSLGRRALDFHSEFAFELNPPRYLSLEALEIDAGAAPTIMANTALAARSLPASLAREIAGRFVCQTFGLEQARFEWQAGQLAAWRPHRICPIVCNDPTTGIVMLSPSPLHSLLITGLALKQSEDLLSRLFDHVYAEHVLVHEWRVGDVMIWNNNIVQHARPGLPTVGKRTLRRSIFRW